MRPTCACCAANGDVNEDDEDLGDLAEVSEEVSSEGEPLQEGKKRAPGPMTVIIGETRLPRGAPRLSRGADCHSETAVI